MNLDLIETTVKAAMALAATKPGPYGGRYVGRKYDRRKKEDRYLILPTDDPEDPRVRDDRELDVFAHCRPETAYGLGHARYWILADGSVDREYFDSRR